MKNDYEISGDKTIIHLQRGLTTVIDTADLPRAMEFPHTWYGTGGNRLYVRGTFHEPRNKRKNSPTHSVSLHRWLTKAPPEKQVDHKNHNTLDNCRSYNLRVGTQSLNQQNREKALCKSGYRGVYPKGNKWKVEVTVNRKRFYFGLWDDEKIAAKVASYARIALMPFTQEEKIS